jgi:hypothetical protein
LAAPFRCVGTRGDLDDQRPRHVTTVGAAIFAWFLGILRRVLEAVSLTLLIAAVVGIGWVAVYVVYKVFQGQR